MDTLVSGAIPHDRDLTTRGLVESILLVVGVFGRIVLLSSQL